MPGSPPALPLDAAPVERQLALRTVHMGGAEQTGGEYVLYWMQAVHRLDENWALRLAIREADRRGVPVVVHQGLDPTYEHASDRIHTFVLDGARETARRAAELGLHYHFVLRRRCDDDRRSVDRLAARAALLVTDLFPTAGIAERTRRAAARVACPVVAVDSSTIVPSGLFPTAQYSAPALRPKLAGLLDDALTPVEDRPPRRAIAPSLAASLEVHPVDWREPTARLVASCEIDHTVPPAALAPGRAAARARLARWTAGALETYEARRREPADADGTSRLSPYLHFGQLGAAEVARAAIAAVGRQAATPFLDELVTWRELAFNFCLRETHYRSLRCTPAWAQETMTRHVDDPRPHLHTLAELEDAASVDALWNAAQRELREAGTIHNAVRMAWGKAVLLWSARYTTALRRLAYLNDRWALDGRDPNGWMNILWCFGRFDRPWPERPVFGRLRALSLARAREKFDADAYLARWSAPGPTSS